MKEITMAEIVKNPEKYKTASYGFLRKKAYNPGKPYGKRDEEKLRRLVKDGKAKVVMEFQTKHLMGTDRYLAVELLD